MKFGIAMLGSMGDENDLEIVRTLALHDEFGLSRPGRLRSWLPRGSRRSMRWRRSWMAGDASKPSR